MYGIHWLASTPVRFAMLTGRHHTRVKESAFAVVRWMVAQVSAAERSIDGTRIRQFTADDLVAFAQAFGLPVTFETASTRSWSTWTRR